MNLAKLQENQYTEITCTSIYNEKSEREIKESIPFTIATKRIKYLGINLRKEKKRTVYRKLNDTDERNQR